LKRPLPKKTYTLSIIGLLGIFALLFLARERGVYCGFLSNDPRNYGDCECDGYKKNVSAIPFVRLEGTQIRCVGRVTKKWEVNGGSSIYFHVTPSDASIAVRGAKIDSMQTQNMPELFSLNNGALSQTGEGSFYIDRSHIITDGKLEYKDKSPLHIEITHSGYKPWIKDIVPESDPIVIKAKLEPETKASKPPQE
jgi:hypothetical protein